MINFKINKCYKVRNPNKDSDYENSSDSCSINQIEIETLNEQTKEINDIDSVRNAYENENSEKILIPVLESENQADKSSFCSLTGQLSDNGNPQEINEVESLVDAEIIISESDENCKISDIKCNYSEKDKIGSQFIADDKVEELKSAVEFQNNGKINDEVEIESLVDIESAENHIEPDKINQKSVEYPQDITTRLGIDRNHDSEDEIQNLQVTLVPIMRPIRETSSAAVLKEENLLRPQSPVCDFIQKVLLESYV